MKIYLQTNMHISPKGRNYLNMTKQEPQEHPTTSLVNVVELGSLNHHEF